MSSIKSNQYVHYNGVKWIPQTGNESGNSIIEISASENHIGEISTSDHTVSVTPILDTNIYAQDDILFDTTEITNVSRIDGGVVILQSLSLIDKSGNNSAIKLVVLNASGSIGTINAAENISDTHGEKILTEINIASGDYSDYANFGRVVKNGSDIGMGIIMKPITGTSLYIAAVFTDATGATYAASDIIIQLGFLRS